MIFADRSDAARRLATALRARVGPRPLVLAIPRGAVPMGRVIADALGGELDVILVRKLRAPWSPEVAVGAVAESGWTYIAPHAEAAGASAEYLAQEGAHQLASLVRRRALYTPGRAPIPVRGRECIVVDDGLATGSTMLAALHAARAGSPSRLLCAVPVASAEALERVARLADETVCLSRPSQFGAVGAFYRGFPQVEDDEVRGILGEAIEAAP